MNNKEVNAAVKAFLDNGGEITLLQYGGKKAANKSHRLAYHKERALSGNERSKAIVEREEAREKTMIFSRIERHKEV